MCQAFRVVIVAAAMAASSLASPSAPSAAHSSSPVSQDNSSITEFTRALLGKLVHTRIDADFQQIPIREATDRLATAIDAAIIGRWADDRIGHGMNPDVPVTLRVKNVRAIDALEIIIDQAALFDPCTWQVRKGFIEIGTKRRLSAPAAIERRLYEVTDLLLQPPYSTRFGQVGGQAFEKHPYRSAALWFGPWDGHQTFDEAARGLVRGITEILAPGNWDYGNELVGAIPGDTRFAPDANALVAKNAVALIRLWKSRKVVVNAPPFIHRQIANTADPIVPKELSELERALRPAPRTDGGPYISFRAIDPSGLPPATSVIQSHERRTRNKILEDPPDRRPARGGSNRDHNSDGGKGATHDDPFPLIHGEVRGDEIVRRLVRALIDRTVTVNFRETPAREAIEEIGRQLRIPLIGRYNDDLLGFGIDSETPITLRVQDERGLGVLEAVLEQCSFPPVECTWQIRRGYVEVGTKSRLSVPAARETRLYFIRDLMVEAPDFTARRTPPEALGLDVVETIVTLVEPDAWDWGQPLEATEPMLESGEAIIENVTGGERSQSRRARRSQKRFVTHVRPAIIRYWRDVVIVHAPDYIHRQLAGYPDPQPR